MSKKYKINIAIVCTTLLIIVTTTCIVLNLNRKSYTIKFNSNGGTIIEKQEVKNGDKIVKPIDPIKKGYKFKGWYLDGKKYYFDKKVTKSITLKAIWIKKGETEEVTIKFDTDGGSKIKDKRIEKGTKLKKPTDPTKEGYIFDGWLLNNNAFEFDTEIVSNIKLVAKWQKIDNDSFVITFNSNGGTNVSSQVVKEKNKVQSPTNPTKNGYTFAGWYLNNKKFDFNTEITENITLIAKWNASSATTPATTKTDTQTKPAEVVKYNVAFNSNGGSSVSTQVITAGGTATAPSNPTKSGYRFVNWMLNGGAYNFSTAVNNNITLVANWELIPVLDVYTVSIELINGETNIPERKAIVYKNGSVITPAQLQNQSGSVLGNYIASLNAIRVNKAQYDSASSLKVKLSDGTVVSASKN